MKVLRTVVMAVSLLGGVLLHNMVQAKTQEPAGSKEPLQQLSPSSYEYYGGLWAQPTLTGDWGGLRNDLAARGVTFDISLTEIVQGVASGGKDNSHPESGGRGLVALRVDTQKLGLWPGGFLSVEAEGNFGNSVNGSTGALSPVNSNQVYPMPDSNEFNVPEVSFTQFFSPYFGLVAGKLDTVTTGDMNDFAHGKGDEQFFNLAFNINPLLVVSTPYSTLGGGIVILPTKDPDAAIISILALDTNGKANSAGFDDAFDDTTVAGQARVRTDFFGLTGHQVVGATYTNKTYGSLDQNLRINLENREISKETGSWTVYYNFDQYLYEVKKGSGQGFGLFGRFGASDGNPNPMNYFFSVGLGGKGVSESRPLDRFGIGYYYVDVSNPEFTRGRLAIVDGGVVLEEQTRSFLGDEQGIEAFYSLAVTPWLHLTPDLQVIWPTQENYLNVVTADGVSIPRKEDVDTAVVLGLRMKVLF
ncbi:carbohydrate porin [Desulforhabdus sp. TSK]|uniref:carbohydrate porin n=1 Tax=Desulforhabdus sp. TSK TaxID=2925014 RepID=UPI001FC7CA12|nr:carbohydrate porin [Desulforhabdus sp. TSK]GKT10689.1 carbohydrate porin [Desulforhabdus sp. TSK]